MSRTFRAADLWSIAAFLGVVAAALWLAGVLVGEPMLRFAGFMAGATTFLPMPADAYVLAAAADSSALAVGLVGGGVNAVVVLVERMWVLRLMRHPSFDRFNEYVGTNRWVDAAQRHLFLGLLVGGFSFLPFEPFRLLAVVNDYGRLRYALATFLGRGLRYYWLARLGLVFDGFGGVKYVVWASLALFVFGLFRSHLRYRTQVRRRRSEAVVVVERGPARGLVAGVLGKDLAGEVR